MKTFTVMVHQMLLNTDGEAAVSQHLTLQEQFFFMLKTVTEVTGGFEILLNRIVLKSRTIGTIPVNGSTSNFKTLHRHETHLEIRNTS